MAHIKSAFKKIEKNEENRLRNKAVTSKLHTVIKKTTANLTTESARVAASTIDKAAAKGVLHKNAAARQKSKIDRAINAK